MIENAILYGISLLLFSAWIYVRIQHIYEKNRSQKIAEANRYLINNNILLNDWLDRSRKQVMHLNKKIGNIEYTEKVYLVVHQNHDIIYGCFRSKEAAVKYLGNSTDHFLKEVYLTD